MNRKNISSRAPWESIAGYSRAVRIGNQIEVAGTVAQNVIDGKSIMVGKNNPAEQTRFVLKKIESALLEAGANLQDVVRTRIFVSRIEDWEDITKVHGEFFSDIRPACTLVAVKALIDPEFLVEIEASAIVQ